MKEASFLLAVQRIVSRVQVAPGVIFDINAGNAGATSSGPTGTNGSSPGGGVGGYSVNGASGSENVFIIDGVESPTSATPRSAARALSRSSSSAKCRSRASTRHRRLDGCKGRLNQAIRQRKRSIMRCN